MPEDDQGTETADPLRYTKEGLQRGLNSSAHRDYVWVTKGAGLVVGGVGGWASAERVLRRFAKQGTLRNMTQVPVLVFAAVTSAFLGKELAPPCATLGVKLGKTASYGLTGVKYDVFGPPEAGRDPWTGRRVPLRGERPTEAQKVLDKEEELQDLMDAAADEVRAARAAAEAAAGADSGAAAREAEQRAEAALARGRAVAELLRELALERSKERDLRAARRGAEDREARRELDAALGELAARKHRLKERARTEFGASLSAELQREMRARVNSLKALRREEARLRARQLRGGSDHREELGEIRAAKKALKAQAHADFDVKLGRVARGRF